MAGLSGLGTALAAAAPGAAQGISNAVGSYQDYQKDKALDASVGQQTGVGPVGTADANHPIWGILNNLTGNPGNVVSNKPLFGSWPCSSACCAVACEKSRRK